MSNVSDTYYMASRVKDARAIVAGSVRRNCTHCNSAVWVDSRLIEIAEDSRGIVCVPCVQEATGKSLAELVQINIHHMTEILKERFGEK